MARLSDIDLYRDGFTADDVIRNRFAGTALMHAAAKRGNRIAQAACELDALARSYGLDVHYSEELDADMDEVDDNFF